MALTAQALEEVICNVLPDNFARDHWSRKACFRPGAAAALSAYDYDADAFMRDICAAQTPPFLTARLKHGHREFARHSTSRDLLAAVEAGGVASIKLSNLWRDGAGLSHWRWMRTLFDSLRDKVCMTCLDPSRTEDTDLFFAGPQSEIGAHFDATHVFTLQLFGARAWTIEQDIRLEERLRTTDRGRGREARLGEPTISVTLRAGDALYVPAYAVHRVTGVDWSVALSFGLRCFNEIDVVSHLLERSPFTLAPPVPTAPASQIDAHAMAKITLARRLRALVAQLEADADALTLGPARAAHQKAPTN